MTPGSISLALGLMLFTQGSRVPPPVPLPPDPIEPPKVAPAEPILPSIAPPAKPVLPPAVTLPAPAPLAVPAPAAPQPVTLEQFAATFKPAPGNYQITFIHPHTKKPVDVAFALPDIPLKKFEVHRRSIEFHYPKREVEINFRLGGKVDVRYEN